MVVITCIYGNDWLQSLSFLTYMSIRFHVYCVQFIWTGQYTCHRLDMYKWQRVHGFAVIDFWYIYPYKRESTTISQHQFAIYWCLVCSVSSWMIRQTGIFVFLQHSQLSFCCLYNGQLAMLICVSLFAPFLVPIWEPTLHSADTSGSRACCYSTHHSSL